MCCPILFVLFGLPRVGIFFLWLFSDRMEIAFDNFWLPFLGFLFLPFTTIFYALAFAPFGGVSGFGWILVAFGLVLDIFSYTGGGEYGRRRRGSYA